MSNSQLFEQLSDPAHAQLLQIDAQLAAQEADLSAQLASIQEKRLSLKIVIDLFAPGNTTQPVTAPPAATPVVETNGKFEVATSKQATPKLGRSIASDSDAATPAADNQNQKTQKTPGTGSKRRAKPTRAAKTSKKTEGWQQYLREEFSNLALSEAVSTLLHQQPQQVLEIATVVDAIFEEQMPLALRSKVRNQVTNILSEGARKNKWHRPQPGSYSLSSQ